MAINFPLQYLFDIAKFIILSLGGWFPHIPTSYLSSYFFRPDFIIKNWIKHSCY